MRRESHILLHEIFKNKRQVLKIHPNPGLLTFRAEIYPTTEMQRPLEKHEETEVHEKRVEERQLKGYQSLLLRLSDKLSKFSAIHGFDRLFGRNTGKFERLLWFIGFFVALGMLLYVSQSVARRYNKRQFKTVVNATRYPLFRIPFPEVTICNNNRLNWSRLPAAKQRFLLPEHQSNPEFDTLFTDIIGRYDTLVFGEFSLFESLAERPLQRLNYVNFSSVVHFMSWRCDELLQDCVWRHFPYDCCEIFIPRISPLGVCLAFNSVESEEGRLRTMLDSMWPWRTSISGPGNGLNVKVLIKEEQHSPYSDDEKGLTFMINEPYIWTNYPINVRINTHTTVAINALLSFYENDTRHLPSSVRECVFEDESHSPDFKTLRGHKYMFENCQAECQQEHLMSYCNCTMDLFYPASIYRPCKLVDLPCLAKNNIYLTHFEQEGETEYIAAKNRGMQCKCFLNCYSLTYITDVRSTFLQVNDSMTNNSVIELDFHFMRDSIIVYKTKLVYTWVDLMVSFGGIAGFFLGASLLSFVELSLYLLIDFPKWLREQYYQRRNNNFKVRKIQENVKRLLALPNKK